MSSGVPEVLPQSERSEDCSQGTGRSSRRPDSRSSRAERRTTVEGRAGNRPVPCHDVNGVDREMSPVTITHADGGLVISPFPAALLAALEYERRSRAGGGWHRDILQHYRLTGPATVWVPRGLLVRVLGLLVEAGYEVVHEADLGPLEIPANAAPFLQEVAVTVRPKLELLLACPTGGVLSSDEDESLPVIVALAHCLRGRRALLVTPRQERGAVLIDAIAQSGIRTGVFCRNVQDAEPFTIMTAGMLRADGFDPAAIDAIILDGIPRKGGSWLEEISGYSNAKRYGLAYLQDYPSWQREFTEGVFGPWIDEGLNPDPSAPTPAEGNRPCREPAFQDQAHRCPAPVEGISAAADHPVHPLKNGRESFRLVLPSVDPSPHTA